MIYPRRWKTRTIFKTKVGKISGNTICFNIEDLRKATEDDVIGKIEPGHFLGSGACDLAFKRAHKSAFDHERVMLIMLEEE